MVSITSNTKTAIIQPNTLEMNNSAIKTQQTDHILYIIYNHFLRSTDVALTSHKYLNISLA